MWCLEDILVEARRRGLATDTSVRPLLSGFLNATPQPASLELEISDAFVDDVCAAFEHRVLAWRPFVGPSGITTHQFAVACLNAFLQGLKALEFQSIIGEGKPRRRTLASSLGLLSMLGERSWCERRIGSRSLADLAFACIGRAASAGVPTWNELREGAGAVVKSNAVEACLARLRRRCQDLRSKLPDAPQGFPELSDVDMADGRLLDGARAGWVEGGFRTTETVRFGRPGLRNSLCGGPVRWQGETEGAAQAVRAVTEGSTQSSVPEIRAGGPES